MDEINKNTNNNFKLAEDELKRQNMNIEALGQWAENMQEAQQQIEARVSQSLQENEQMLQMLANAEATLERLQQECRTTTQQTSEEIYR